MALSNEVTLLNSNLDNCIHQNDMPSHDDLSHAFDESNEDMTSLCLKGNLKVKFHFCQKNLAC